MPIEKPVPYPVIKKVPYPVEKPVPVHVEKEVSGYLIEPLCFKGLGLRAGLKVPLVNASPNLTKLFCYRNLLIFVLDTAFAA